MTSLIRSARVALEAKLLPVTTLPPAPLQLGGSAILGSGKPQPYGAVVGAVPHTAAASAAQTAASPAGQAVAAGCSHSQPASQSVPPAPVTPTVTYEEYKQRFAAELAELRNQALEKSKAEGLQMGRQAAEADNRRALQALRAVLESARSAQQRYIEDIADDAAEIVLAAVGKILGEGFADRTAAVAAVREAIRQCQEGSQLLIRVAPEDFEVLDARRRELLEGLSTQEIELIADSQVKMGGCILEAASGALDARLEVQLQRLQMALLAARQEWEQPA